jgi:hypothetical protein
MSEVNQLTVLVAASPPIGLEVNVSSVHCDRSSSSSSPCPFPFPFLFPELDPISSSSSESDNSIAAPPLRIEDWPYLAAILMYRSLREGKVVSYKSR